MHLGGSLLLYYQNYAIEKQKAFYKINCFTIQIDYFAIQIWCNNGSFSLSLGRNFNISKKNKMLT